MAVRSRTPQNELLLCVWGNGQTVLKTAFSSMPYIFFFFLRMTFLAKIFGLYFDKIVPVKVSYFKKNVALLLVRNTVYHRK